MSRLICIFILGLIMTVTGMRISSTCVDLCKEESSIKCARPCDRDVALLGSLRSIYGRDTVDGCLTPCRCDKIEFVYPADKICQILQSFVVKSEGCGCSRGANLWSYNLAKWKIQEPEKFVKKNVIDYLAKREGVSLTIQRGLKPRTEATTVNPWENWCKHQCAEGMGGSACYCDIIP